MTEEQKYRKDPRINASTLKKFVNDDLDPAIAMWQLKNPSPPSEAMLLGTMVHSIIENLGDAPEGVQVSPFDSYRSKEAKTWKEQMEADGQIIVTEATLDKAYTMANNVLQLTPSSVYEIIHDPDSGREKAFFTDDLKALVDCISRTGDTVLDYKTTGATSSGKFMKDCWNYGYALQAYHYMKVTGAVNFVFVAVSSVAPHPVWTLQCTPKFIEWGGTLWRKAMARYKQAKAECLGLDVRMSVLEELDKPYWVKDSAEEVDWT